MTTDLKLDLRTAIASSTKAGPNRARTIVLCYGSREDRDAALAAIEQVRGE